MGEMSDMELESVAQMEAYRDAYASGDMSQEEAFDMDFIDSMGRETEGLDGAYARQVFTEEDMNSQLQHYSTCMGSPLNNNTVAKHTNSNRSKTIAYLKAFMIFYKTYGYLSPKQQAIIEMNVDGGVEEFIKRSKHC